MVGFKLVKADGFTSVVVPFFSKGDGYWECGWSKDRIKAVLQSKDGVIDTPAAPVQPVMTQAPQPMAQAPQPPPAPIPPQNQTPYQPPSTPPPTVLSTNTPAAPDGVTLQPGERIVTLTDLDGNPQRAVRKADGTIRVIFK